MRTGRKGKGEPRLERPEMRERIMQVSAEGMGKENPGKREQKKRKEELRKWRAEGRGKENAGRKSRREGKR